MKKVRKVRWHGVVRETLKAQANNFVLDPRFNWTHKVRGGGGGGTEEQEKNFILFEETEQSKHP